LLRRFPRARFRSPSDPVSSPVLNHAPRKLRPSTSVGAVRRSFAPWADPKAEPLIRFEGVAKRFGDIVAVDDLTLSIHEREFFCLLGPSGCGKTTLMRMLAGFEAPTAGQVILGGQDLAGIPPHRRPVNMMFQSYALFPHMTVAGNVAYGLKVSGVPRAEIAPRVAEALAMIRYHSFYAAHKENAYTHLMNRRDQELLEWVRAFNPYDLYSKDAARPDVTALRPYYEDLIAEFEALPQEKKSS